MSIVSGIIAVPAVSFIVYWRGCCFDCCPRLCCCSLRAVLAVHAVLLKLNKSTKMIAMNTAINHIYTKMIAMTNRQDHMDMHGRGSCMEGCLLAQATALQSRGRAYAQLCGGHTVTPRLRATLRWSHRTHTHVCTQSCLHPPVQSADNGWQSAKRRWNCLLPCNPLPNHSHW